VRLMTNRWSHRRISSTCVFNFEVDKPTNYHLLASFHFINKMCLIRQFVCCKGVPENIWEVRVFFILSDWKLSWKSWGLPKVLLTHAKQQIPNMLNINYFSHEEASLETL
jgi:hypothetical protein